MQTYVEAMQPGYNLGNTLDAVPEETSWGMPPTTQNIIQHIAAQGYKSIRIPVTWYPHVGPAPAYAVDPAWMDRVQQIVDWSLQSGLIVMLNMHHDSGWVSSMPTNHDAVVAQFSATWAQISTRFRDYPNTLMFEAINEPQFKDVDHATALADLNELQTAFYHTVRDSGGANATRPLVMAAYQTNAAQDILDSLKGMILGLNDNNIIATIHYYGFWPFSVNNSGYTKFEEVSINDITTSFDNAYNTFVSEGIPVVVGEIGVLAPGSVEHGEALKYFDYSLSYIRAKGMTHMLWDTTTYFDRTRLEWNDPDLYAVMRQTLQRRATTADTDLVFVKSGAPVADAYVNLNLNGNAFVSLSDGATTLNEGDAYKLQGSLLTIKGSYLTRYASGAFGEKAVLKVNVNSGPAWKIHVRYHGTPSLSASTGSITGLSIPVKFNGDLLSTIEAKYDDGTPAGPINWNPFQEFDYSFLPNYGNNTVTLKDTYFAAVHNGTINLALHFWSGAVLNYQVYLGLRGTTGGPDYIVYNDTLAAGWNNWSSWVANDLASAAPVHSGSKAISVTSGAWGGFVLQNGAAPFDTSIYHSIVFWINGGSAGGQSLGIAPIRGSTWGPGSTSIPAPTANTWTKVQIPLSALGVEGSSDITGFYIQNWTGGDAPTFYLDDLALSTSVAPNDLVVTGSIPAPSPLTITRNGFTLNRRTNTMVQTVTIMNPTSSAVSGPIYLVLDSLSSTTSLLNATGITSTVVPVNSPYIKVTTGALPPRSSVAVSLQFKVPAYGSISYGARVLGEGTTP